MNKAKAAVFMGINQAFEVKEYPITALMVGDFFTVSLGRTNAEKSRVMSRTVTSPQHKRMVSLKVSKIDKSKAQPQTIKVQTAKRAKKPFL